MKKSILPPTYVYLAIAIMLGLHFLLPGPTWLYRPWTYLGLIPVLLGIWLNMNADSAFKRASTTVKPFQKSSALVTSGAFRISRHPMYLGFVLLLFGLWVFLGTATPLLPVLVLPLLLQRIFVPFEEKMMLDTFGEEYRTYMGRVRQWLGRFK